MFAGTILNHSRHFDTRTARAATCSRATCSGPPKRRLSPLYRASHESEQFLDATPSRAIVRDRPDRAYIARSRAHGRDSWRGYFARREPGQAGQASRGCGRVGGQADRQAGRRRAWASSRVPVRRFKYLTALKRAHQRSIAAIIREQ